MLPLTHARSPLVGTSRILTPSEHIFASAKRSRTCFLESRPRPTASAMSLVTSNTPPSHLASASFASFQLRQPVKSSSAGAGSRVRNPWASSCVRLLFWRAGECESLCSIILRRPSNTVKVAQCRPVEALENLRKGATRRCHSPSQSRPYAC